MPKNLLQTHLKRSQKKQFQKTVEATGDLIGNKIANIITKVSKHLQQNNAEKVKNEHYNEPPKERYMSPEERQKINISIIK